MSRLRSSERDHIRTASSVVGIYHASSSVGIASSPAIIESKPEETKVEGMTWWEEKLEELGPLHETTLNLAIRPLREATSEELEEKFRLLSPSFNHLQGIIQAKMFEGSSQETIIRTEEEMLNFLKENVEKRAISEEAKTFLEDLGKLLEVDKFFINRPQIVSRKEFPIFLSYVFSLQYTVAAGLVLVEDKGVIAWLSEKGKEYVEIIDAYLNAFNTETSEAYERLRRLEERGKTFEDKVIRTDSFSRPIPKGEAILWIYYFSNQALEEKESKYQGHSNALFRFGISHRDVNAFMALKEEEPLVKEVLEEFDLSENDLPFLIISPFKLNLGKERVPKDRIYVIKKGAFTDRLCDYNNAIDFYGGLYEAQKEEKSLRTFILSEKFKTLTGVAWDQIKHFISLSKPF